MQYHTDLHVQSLGREHLTHSTPTMYISAGTKFSPLTPLHLPQNVPYIAICNLFYIFFEARMNNSFYFSLFKKNLQTLAGLKSK
jgi:hypothetical protein